MYFFCFLFCFSVNIVFSQHISDVKFPNIIRHLDSIDCDSYQSYSIDSCLIKLHDKNVYFKFLYTHIYPESKSFPSVDKKGDTLIGVSLPFELIDTICVDNKVYIAFNPYERSIFESKSRSPNSNIIDGVIITKPNFVIINSKVTYAPFELTDRNISDFFFSDRSYLFIKFIENNGQ
jgi:hypothetical protein